MAEAFYALAHRFLRFRARAALRVAALPLLLFLVAGVSIRVFDLFHWHDSQRSLELIALLIVCAATLSAPAVLRSLLGEALQWLGVRGLAALSVAGAFGLLSSIRAEAPRFALTEVSLLFLVGLCAFVVARVRRSEGHRFDTWLVCLILAAAAALVAPFLVAWLAAVSSGAGFIPGLLYQSGFSNVRFLGQFHTLSLPLLAFACLMPFPRPSYRYLAFLLLALTWTMAIGTATRATWFSWAAAVLVLVPFARKGLLPLLGIQLAGLSVGALGAWAMFDLAPRMASVEGDPPTLGGFVGRFSDPLALSMRDQLWTRAMELIVAHPFTGIGPMMLALDHSPVAAHPHNALLQLAVEWGMPAAIVVAIVGVRLWLKLATGLRVIHFRGVARDGYSHLLPVALLWALSGAAIHAMVDGLLVMPYAQIACAVILGWTLGVFGTLLRSRLASTVWLRTTVGKRTVPLLRAVAAVAVAAAGIQLAAGTMPELLRLDAREIEYFDRYPFDLPRKPRLWAQGWLHEDVPPRDPQHPPRLMPPSR